MKLYFHPSTWIQQPQQLQALNLMLVFQVNCPGCLVHALPLLESLDERFADLNAFALSTAFEDFSLNTVENTRKLLETQELTQTSKRYYARLGHKALPYRVNIPVVMDSFLSEDQLNQMMKQVVDCLEAEAPLSPQVSQQVKNQLTQRVAPTAKTGRTFLNNQMQGTPSWYLFDQNLEILDSWFGHKEPQWVEAMIERYFEQ